MDYYRPSDKFSCIIVGTRCNSPARKVAYERAAGYAEMRGFPYMELDLAHMSDVQRVFDALLDSVKVTLHQDPPLLIDIRPDISTNDLRVSRSVVCACWKTDLSVRSLSTWSKKLPAVQKMNLIYIYTFQAVYSLCWKRFFSLKYF